MELGNDIEKFFKTRDTHNERLQNSRGRSRARQKGHTSRGISGFKIRINLLEYTFSREFSNKILSFSRRHVYFTKHSDIAQVPSKSFERARNHKGFRELRVDF